LTKVPLISIVDDDEPVREATRRFLVSLSYAADTFSSAGAFLKSDRVGDTASLLTDVQMPGVSGLELQRRLTEQGYPLPIIFITAFPVRANWCAYPALNIRVFTQPGPRTDMRCLLEADRASHLRPKSYKIIRGAPSISLDSYYDQKLQRNTDGRWSGKPAVKTTRLPHFGRGPVVNVRPSGAG